jgi:hypothetical protein
MGRPQLSRDPLGGGMELETDIERADFEAFFDHYQSAGASSRFRTIIWAWFLALIAVLAALRFARHGVSPSSLIWSGAFIVWAVLGKRWLRWLSGRFLSASLAKQDLSAHLGAQRLSVTPEGLRCESNASSSTMSWANLKRIEDGPGHTFIYFSDISAFIVPHRSVAPDQLSAFLAEIRRRSAA